MGYSYIEVEIDHDEVLEDISTKDLRSELNSRNEKMSVTEKEFIETIKNAEYMARKHGDMSLAIRLEEIVMEARAND